MVGKRIFWALIPALMGSTAALAQDGGIALTTGVVMLSLPAVETGVFGSAAGSASSDVDDLAIGAMLGLDARVNLGPIGPSQSFIGFSGYGAIARGSSSNSTTLDGEGLLVVPGYTTPTDFTIDLTSSTGGGSANAASLLDQTAVAESNDVTAVGETGEAYGWGVNPGDGANDPSFLYGGIFVDGTAGAERAAAFGAVADEDGNILIAVGDLTGVVVTNEVSQTVAHFGGDITFGLSGSPASNVSLSGFVGPSYKFLGRDISSETTVDFPELGSSGTVVLPGGGTVSGVEFPFYSRMRDEEIDTHYIGGVIGGSLSTPLSDSMVLNLGAKGGIYAMNTTATGTETASVHGGNPAPVTDPTVVANSNTLSLSDNGMAYSLQGNASVTMPLSASTQLTIGAGAEYLSRVAAIGPMEAAAVTPAAGDASYSATEDLRPMLSFGDMWSFTGFVTFSGQF